MIASVKPCHVVAPAFVRCSVPLTPQSTAAAIAAPRSATRRRQRQTLIRDHGELALSREREQSILVTKFTLRRAAAQPVEARTRTTSTPGAYDSAACSPASFEIA